MACLPHLKNHWRRLVCLALLVGSLLIFGCDGPEHTQVELFEHAEVAYRSGDYDVALDGYQAFLHAYPDSPLAKTAKLRVRSINREVHSVMTRKDMPRPNYVGRGDTPGTSSKGASKADAGAEPAAADAGEGHNK